MKSQLWDTDLESVPEAEAEADAPPRPLEADAAAAATEGGNQPA